MTYDCTVIGSGPAGLTAALYMARGGYDTLVLTGDEPGGKLNEIEAIENYPGFERISGIDLFTKMQEQCVKAGVKFFDFIGATKIIRNPGEPFEISISDGGKVFSRAIIMCNGTKNRTLGFDGEKDLIGKGIHFCATCDAPFYRDRDVVVLGGGNSAFSSALSLAKHAKSVRIVHRGSQFRASDDMMKMVKHDSSITLVTNFTVSKIGRENGTLVISGKNGECIEADGVFYAIGFERETIPQEISGEDSFIVPAGDCSTNRNKQVVIACGEGCSAAMDCIEYLKRNN